MRYNRTIDNVLRTARIIERTIEKKLQPHGLSVPQFEILTLVARYQVMRPKQIAVAMLQEAHSVSGLLNRLEDRDLIQRQRGRQIGGDGDGRQVFVTLTAEGAALHKAGAAALAYTLSSLEESFLSTSLSSGSVFDGMSLRALQLVPDALATEHKKLTRPD